MDINVPKIVRPLALAEYAPELAPLTLQVWVNPPRKLLAEILDQETQSEELAAQRMHRLYEIIAELWSQGPDPETHWTVDEVVKLIEEKRETDPALFGWLRTETFAMIGAYRNAKKKD